VFRYAEQIIRNNKNIQFAMQHENKLVHSHGDNFSRMVDTIAASSYGMEVKPEHG